MTDVKVTVHMLVKNEDRFVWYAIKSILPYVHKIIITDSGSSDNTINIIESIRDPKILFNKKRINTADEIAKIRQEQLNMTETDWFWIVDGDEIYPDYLCREIIDYLEINGTKLEGIVVRRFDLLGDIYHIQSENVGSYILFGKKGHQVIRLINKKNFPGLNVKGIYPFEGYYDKNGIEIIYHDSKKFMFTKSRLFHAMYLVRSTKGGNLMDTFHRRKYKIELGNSLPQEFLIPKVFRLERPNLVPEVIDKRPLFYEFMASIFTPVKMFKRKLKLL